MMAFETICMWMASAITTAAAQPQGKGASEAGSSRLPDVAGGDGNNAPMTDIHDIKPILDLGADWQWVIVPACILALLLVLALAWWYWRRHRRPVTPVAAAPPIAPDAEAYNALDALAVENGLEPKQFYFRLSAVLRHYMERRFEFPAAEMTSEELLPRVDQLSLDATLANEFKSLCRAADPIKFAGAAAAIERLARDLAFARDFVRQTTARSETLEEDDGPSSTSMEVKPT